MSTKAAFFTHECLNVGKKSDFLPMMARLCPQNRTFLCMSLLEPTKPEPNAKADKNSLLYLENMGEVWK